jgi:hypothetical protein
LSHLIRVTVSPGPNHIDVDLDPTFPVDAVPDPIFPVDAVPDPTFPFNVDQDPTFPVDVVPDPTSFTLMRIHFFLQIDANVESLKPAYRPFRL